MSWIWCSEEATGDTDWLTETGSVSVSSSITPGVWATYGFGFYGTGTSNSGDSVWDGAVSEFRGQGRIYWRTGAPSSSGPFVGFRSPNGVVNCSLGTGTGGQLRAFRGTSTVLGTGTTVLSATTWYYVQYRVVIHDTTGIFVVKLNGTEEINLTSQDTRSDAAAGGDTCDRCYFDRLTSGQPVFGDFWINSVAGSVNNDYPDNIGIEALVVNAAGGGTQLTRGGTDSGSNFGQVDERPSNDVTDYVYGSTVGDRDLYGFPDTRWGNVDGVALSVRAQKSDAGAASMGHVLKYDSDANGTADTEATGADMALSNSWSRRTRRYDQQPDSTNWSPAKVNGSALEAGVKVR